MSSPATGCSGPPTTWTRAAAAAVHEAGGLYVADEVQAGHGRTGHHLWSFVAGDVPADLVTLGKPMGNGYPVAAVVGPADLVDPFVRGTDYFSTFGGSTAACAAALAVLRTIDEERSRRPCRASWVRTCSEPCARSRPDHPDLAAVRGWGLALAVDIVDPATGQPDADRAGRIVEGMRERGVLIGRTGRDRATLKIRPPLVFADEHVDQLASALAATCAESADPRQDTFHERRNVMWLSRNCSSRTYGVGSTIRASRRWRPVRFSWTVSWSAHAATSTPSTYQVMS